jgi:hypothetical protein
MEKPHLWPGWIPMNPDVTAISVFFDDFELLKRNAELSEALNPERSFTWIAVDNGGQDNTGFRESTRFAPCMGTPDIPESVSLDRGSLHHSQGLMAGLESGISTRFLLVMDPDFYVVRPHWMEDVLEHMRNRRLTLFGSCWHPRWWYQYRDFPTVHFMMIDLERLPLEQLDFTPGIRDDRYYRSVSDLTWLPLTLSRLLLMGRFKDTGYRVRETVLAQRCHQYETLTIHFTPQWSHPLLGWILSRFPWLVPKRFIRTPRKGTYAVESFLQQVAPNGYAKGWEEFYWRDKPFAFHLRNIGREKATSASDPELLHTFQKAIECRLPDGERW